MKEKIIMLVIGIIIGVVVAGACFWFATSVIGANSLGGDMPEMEDRGDRGGMKPDQEMDEENTTSTTNTTTNANT